MHNPNKKLVLLLYSRVSLNKQKDDLIIEKLLSNENTPRLFSDCYKPFFQSKKDSYLRSIASNPEALKEFPKEFEKLLDVKNYDIMKIAFRNDVARKTFPEKFNEYLQMSKEEIKDLDTQQKLSQLYTINDIFTEIFYDE